MTSGDHHLPPAVPLAAAPPAERRWLVLLVLGGFGLVLGTFLPWLRSGTVWRTSYEVWQSADRLGVLSGGAAETLHVAWFLLPLGAAGLLVTVALDLPRVSAFVAFSMGVLGLLGAGVALGAPLTTGVGPLVTLAASGLLVVAAVANIVSFRRRQGRGDGGRADAGWGTR